MRNVVRWLFGALAALVLVSIATGALLSKFYWGYWFAPPSLKPWVDDFRSVDAIGHLTCEPGRLGKVEAVPAAEIPKLAASYLDSPADYPTYQLLAALQATGLTVPGTMPTSENTQLLCDVLLGSRFIVDGDPGYEHARFIHGIAIVGTRRPSDRVVVLSALGGEASNDHHPVYDVEFIERGSQHWEVLRHHQYFEDIAGIEGLRWFPIALLCFIAGLVLTLVIATGVWSTRLFARRIRALKSFH